MLERAQEVLVDAHRLVVAARGLSGLLHEAAVGWRYIHDTASNIIALGGNYKLNEKHTVALRELYDIDQGRNVSTELVYVRRWPRWYSAVTLDVDKTLDDVGINLSVWPEGAPNLGLGSKRYTGLGDSVGLNVR